LGKGATGEVYLGNHSITKEKILMII